MIKVFGLFMLHKILTIALTMLVLIVMKRAKIIGVKTMILNTAFGPMKTQRI